MRAELKLFRDDGTLIDRRMFNALQPYELRLNPFGAGPIVEAGLQFWGWNYEPSIAQIPETDKQEHTPHRQDRPADSLGPGQGGGVEI